jgi:hypothetical protein
MSVLQKRIGAKLGVKLKFMGCFRITKSDMGGLQESKFEVKYSEYKNNIKGYVSKKHISPKVYYHDIMDKRDGE